jgi:ribosome-associated translation inhibitor RaiA
VIQALATLFRGGRAVQVQVHTDSSVHRSDSLTQAVEAAVEGAVRRWTQRITRVEVHLSDVNRHKGGSDDKRCLMEARVGGLQPVAVTHLAGTMPEAIDGAAEKLKKSLENLLGRLNDR